MKTLQFKGCRVLIFPAARTLVTQFPDGTEVPAAPNYDEESIARAHSLGYDGDPWQMTIGHEVGHTVLAEMDGLDYSPALWAVAHPKEPRDADELHREECRVLEMQRFSQLMHKAVKILR